MANGETIILYVQMFNYQHLHILYAVQYIQCCNVSKHANL